MNGEECNQARRWLKPVVCAFLSFLLVAVGGQATHDDTAGPKIGPRMGLSGATMAGEAEKPIVFLGNRSYPPLEYLEYGEPAGCNVELLKMIGKVLGRPVEIRLMKWSDAQRKLLAGEGDALTMMPRTPERERLYDFTFTTVELGFHIFALSKNISIFSKKDFSGKKIGLTKGGLPYRVLPKFHPEATYVIIEDDLDGFGRLLKGELDGVATELLTGIYKINKHGAHNIQKVPEPFIVRDFAIPVPRGNAELVRQLNNAISILKESGELTRAFEFDPNSVATGQSNYLHLNNPYILAAILFFVVAFVIVGIVCVISRINHA